MNYLSKRKEVETMPFQNQQNGKSDSVNSSCFQLFNKDGKISASTLALGLWDQLITLKMHPAKEPSKQTKTSVYDYSIAINLSFSATIALSIAEVLKENFVSALKKGEEATVMFPIGSDGGLVLSTGVKRFGAFTPYLEIMRKIQPKTLQPEFYMIYQFNSLPYIKDYDGSTAADATALNSGVVYGEVLYFISALERLANDLLGGDRHINRFYSKRFDHEVMALYRSLANSLGVEFYAQTASAGRSSGGPSAFAGVFNSGNGGARPTAPTVPGVTPQRVESANQIELDKFM
jgi:hypothetical protein